jgi:hypothetical protein
MRRKLVSLEATGPVACSRGHRWDGAQGPEEEEDGEEEAGGRHMRHKRKKWQRAIAVEEVVFECEKECGFYGTQGTVEEHELNCHFQVSRG